MTQSVYVLPLSTRMPARGFPMWLALVAARLLGFEKGFVKTPSRNVILAVCHIHSCSTQGTNKQTNKTKHASLLNGEMARLSLQKLMWKANFWKKHLNGRESERGSSCLLVYSPSVHRCWGWAVLKLEARNPTQVSHVGGSDLRAIAWCLLRAGA